MFVSVLIFLLHMILTEDITDFLETADSIYHHQVTEIQMEIHKKKIHYYKSVEAWALEEYEKFPQHKKAIESEINQNMDNFQQNAVWELQQNMRRLDLERARLKIAIMQLVDGGG